MILKQKKNCKMLYVNYKYYIKTPKNLYHFGDNLVEAEEYYKNIVEIEEKGILPFSQGKFKIEFYPSELTDILRALEIYKFAVDKSLFLKCDYEYLKEKSFDLEMLTDYIFCIYNNYINQVKESSKNYKNRETKGKESKKHNISLN